MNHSYPGVELIHFGATEVDTGLFIEDQHKYLSVVKPGGAKSHSPRASFQNVSKEIPTKWQQEILSF